MVNMAIVFVLFLSLFSLSILLYESRCIQDCKPINLRKACVSMINAYVLTSCLNSQFHHWNQFPCMASFLVLNSRGFDHIACFSLSSPTQLTLHPTKRPSHLAAN